jgi:hypothetical protein
MVDPLANSAFRSNRSPLVTKKIGMNTQKPTVSSLSRKCGCVIASTRSINDRSAPAANAPRIVSSLTCAASAVNRISRTNAARTRICTVP